MFEFDNYAHTLLIHRVSSIFAVDFKNYMESEGTTVPSFVCQMFAEIEGKIRHALEQSILESSQFLLKVQLSGHPGSRRKLTIWVDSTQGITVDDCAEISRKLGDLLDAESWIEDAYALEVGTAGADAPLTDVRQYPKHIGRTLWVKLTDGEVLEGTLKEVTAVHVTLEVWKKIKGQKATPEIRMLPFESMEKTKVVLAF